MTSAKLSHRRQVSPHATKAANFRSVHQLSYEERLYSKTDPRVAVASISALAASHTSALHSCTSLRQDPDSPAPPMDMEAALAELGTLRSEMAALQAAITVLKGDKSASAMGTIRPRTPTKAALTARAHALKRSRVAQHQQMDLERKIQAELVASAAAARLPPPSNLQEEVRQKLIDESLVEHQEQYKEDPVQPTTLEDAVALIKLLTTSLPLGSIQAKVSDDWALRPSQEEARLMSDMQLLQQDYQLITMVHGEAIKQVASWCSDEAGVLSGLRDRYMELFGVMLSTSAEAQRMYVSMAGQKQQAEKALKGKEKLVSNLQQQLLKRNEQFDQLKRMHEGLQGVLDSTKESTTTEIAHLTAVCKAHSERTAELSAMLSEVEESHAREMSRLTRTTTCQLAQATEANQELHSRNEYLERQLEKAKLRPPRAVLVSEAEVQTEAMQEPEPEQVFLESTPAPPSPRTPRKKSKVWMGNFADMFTSKPIPVGRAHSKSWILKVLGQLWADKCAQDIADPTQNAGKSFCQWVYDWHIHRFGLTNLAEINLADLIKSVQVCWKQSAKVTHFGQLTAIIQSRNLPRWIAKEDHEFYQMLLNNTATACQPPSILTLFLDGEVSPVLRVTPAIDTVKAVFRHLEDPEAGREFFATTFENLQDVKAGTIPADPLMQALLDHYLKRLSVNRTTLQALFKAADSDGHGVLDRPQARAALTLAQPDLIDTAITTIWLEQEKYAVSEAVAKESVDADAFVDAARTHGFGMWKLDCRLFGAAQLATPTGWRPSTPSASFRDTLFKQLEDAAANCKPTLTEQVKQVRVMLPSSARKDGIALEGQLAHFQQLLEEGSDAEAAYLAEQLLVGQLHYLISMYLPEDTVTVIDPYAASSLRSSSRPLTPQVVPGGLRAAPPMTTAAAAKWAAAALQGSFRPRSRGLLGGSNGSTLSSQGSGASAFAAAAARVAAMAAAGAGTEFALPPLPPPARSSLGSSDGQRSANRLLVL